MAPVGGSPDSLRIEMWFAVLKEISVPTILVGGDLLHAHDIIPRLANRQVVVQKMDTREERVANGEGRERKANGGIRKRETMRSPEFPVFLWRIVAQVDQSRVQEQFDRYTRQGDTSEGGHLRDNHSSPTQRDKRVEDFFKDPASNRKEMERERVQRPVDQPITATDHAEGSNGRST